MNDETYNGEPENFKATKTDRGFEIIAFKDYNDEPCNLQQSSIAHYEQPGSSAVWLGVITEADERSARMHLSRAQVKHLISYLTTWAESGSFEAGPNPEQTLDPDKEEGKREES